METMHMFSQLYSWLAEGEMTGLFVLSPLSNDSDNAHIRTLYLFPLLTNSINTHAQYTQEDIPSSQLTVF